MAQGGFTGKVKAWRQKKNAQLLALEDPQQPGTDIGSGSFNIQEVCSLCAAQMVEERLSSTCFQLERVD